MVLITGGMGFIGLHTARKFLDAGENVIITRFRTSREPSFLKDEFGKRVIVESLDTTSPFDCLSLVRKHNVDSIVSSGDAGAFRALARRGFSGQHAGPRQSARGRASRSRAASH
jgi:nucleoside-diphosphate-sugar epimerase